MNHLSESVILEADKLAKEHNLSRRTTSFATDPKAKKRHVVESIATLKDGAIGREDTYHFDGPILVAGRDDANCFSRCCKAKATFYFLGLPVPGTHEEQEAEEPIKEVAAVKEAEAAEAKAEEKSKKKEAVKKAKKKPKKKAEVVKFDRASKEHARFLRQHIVSVLGDDFKQNEELLKIARSLVTALHGDVDVLDNGKVPESFDNFCLTYLEEKKKALAPSEADIEDGDDDDLI